MKHIKVLLAFALILTVTMPLQAQKFLKKELKIENEEKDGFEFRWYCYSYLQGQDTLYAAYTLNGDRITPICTAIGKQHRGCEPWYCGGGIFMYTTEKRNAFGDILRVGYNLRGEIVFPEDLEATFILYSGDGKFWLEHKTDYGRRIESAYDVNGNCLIPAGLEYNWIGYCPQYNCFWCDYKDASGNKTAGFTYTTDGKYFAEGEYSSSGNYNPTGHYNLSDPKERAIFDKHKKPNPYISTGRSTHTQQQQPVQQQQAQQQQPTPPPQPQPRQPQPMQVWVPCFSCGGSGQCHICLGGGTSLTNHNSRCYLCSGTGRCTHCAGQGGHNEIQYR
ncbi:MAG: hypothetical protein IKM79_01170 [Bacteroidales bacterium]|nr:hypothetical protein [Bacteroidales bacterium]